MLLLFERTPRLNKEKVIEESVFNLTKYTFIVLTNQKATSCQESVTAFIAVKREKKVCSIIIKQNQSIQQETPPGLLMFIHLIKILYFSLAYIMTVRHDSFNI